MELAHWSKHLNLAPFFLPAEAHMLEDATLFDANAFLPFSKFKRILRSFSKVEMLKLVTKVNGFITILADREHFDVTGHYCFLLWPYIVTSIMKDGWNGQKNAKEI